MTDIENILHIIATTPNTSFRKIREISGIHNSKLSRILDRLIKNEKIFREGHRGEYRYYAMSSDSKTKGEVLKVVDLETVSIFEQCKRNDPLYRLDLLLRKVKNDTI